MNMKNGTQKGFTLIELIVVVAIIAIIASVAVPAYTDYVKRGKAAEATGTLADLRVRMEQCFQDNRDYTLCAAQCAPASGAVNFAFSCTTQTATAYTLQAAGAGDMSNFSFTVDENNAKTSEFDGTVGSTCWLTKKNGSC